MKISDLFVFLGAWIFLPSCDTSSTRIVKEPDGVAFLGVPGQSTHGDIDISVSTVGGTVSFSLSRGEKTLASDISQASKYSRWVLFTDGEIVFLDSGDIGSTFYKSPLFEKEALAHSSLRDDFDKRMIPEWFIDLLPSTTREFFR